jgi:hypothetical protein
MSTCVAWNAKIEIEAHKGIVALLKSGWQVGTEAAFGHLASTLAYCGHLGNVGCSVDKNSFPPAVSFRSIFDLRFLHRLHLHV